MPDIPIYGPDQQDQMQQNTDPRVQKLYAQVDVMNGIVSQAGLSSEEQYLLNYEIAHQNSMHVGGISADEAKGLMRKLGLDPRQYQAMLDIGKLKKAYEAAQSDPATAKNFWDGDYAGFGQKGDTMLRDATSVLGDVSSRFQENKDKQAAADKAAADEQAQGDGLNRELVSFINQMHGAPSSNDPVMRGLTNAGQSAAEQSAGARGIEGGMSGAMNQFGAQAAAAPYLQNRQNLALQGMQTLNQRDLGLRAAGLAQLQAQNSASAANFGSAQNNGANIGGLIGSTAGGVLSAVYPQYSAAFSQLGKLGAGAGGIVGGATAGGTPTIQGTSGYKPPTNFTPSSGSGG